MKNENIYNKMHASKFGRNPRFQTIREIKIAIGNLEKKENEAEKLRDKIKKYKNKKDEKSINEKSNLQKRRRQAQRLVKKITGELRQKFSTIGIVSTYDSCTKTMKLNINEQKNYRWYKCHKCDKNDDDDNLQAEISIKNKNIEIEFICKTCLKEQECFDILVQEFGYHVKPKKCSRCEENLFKLKSISPNRKSVKWQCAYCGKNSIIKTVKIEAVNNRYIPDDIRLLILERDGFRCVKCESNENIQIDHIIPFSKGGSNDPQNLQILCQTCNLQKSNN